MWVKIQARFYGMQYGGNEHATFFAELAPILKPMKDLATFCGWMNNLAVCLKMNERFTVSCMVIFDCISLISL